MAGQSPPAVSVIVPAYGVAHLVGDALRSLQAQSFTDWEAIVIDDGAPDDVEAAVAPFSGDPRIRLILTDNGGLATARNRAISMSRAPLIALLDGDDMYQPDYLEKMVAAIEANASAGIVTCDATYFGDSRIGERFSDYVPQAEPVTLEQVLLRHFNIFICSLFRVTAYLEAGGFDGMLRSAEDLDLWLRMIECGWGVTYLNSPLAHYRRRAGSLSSQTAHLLAAELRVYEKAEQRLSGRPESRAAADMRALISLRLARIEGETLILSGSTKAGLTRLKEGAMAEQSVRWAVVMRILRLLPPLARPVFAIRARMNQ